MYLGNQDGSPSTVLLSSDVNPLCSLGEDDRGSDPPDSYLLCISESWDQKTKQVTIGVVVSQGNTTFLGGVPPVCLLQQ